MHQALKDVDVILFMIGPGVLDEIDNKILKMIPEVTPIVLAINKVDLLKEKSKLLGFIGASTSSIFKRFFKIFCH